MEKGLPEGSTLAYTRGCDWTEKTETTLEDGGDERALMLRYFMNRRIETNEVIDEAQALKQAAASDVIIAAMGENTLLCGENRDRGSLRLPGRQEEFVQKLIDTGKPVVLILFGGRAQVISGLAEQCAAIIQAWYPGEEGGNAVADILYGKINPSGKLSVSYPSVELHENICYNHSNQPDERIAYPFGYGLSYTTFGYSDLELPAEIRTDDESIAVTFRVSNEGLMAGDEVAQLYLSPTSKDQPLKPISLQGFTRISLNPGESRTMTLHLSLQQFGHYEHGQWQVDPGTYRISIGSSSTDLRLCGEVRLTGTSRTIPLRSIYFTE